MSIISLMTRQPASIQGVWLFRVVRPGVSLQETTGKNSHLPVVTFYSPPPLSEPASHRRFRHQLRSHSPTHLHTSASPHLSDFLPPRLPPKPVPPHAPFCTNSPTPHPTTRHIPQKTRPSPTLYTLYNCSTSNIFKIIMSQVLDICTPIWYNKYSKHIRKEHSICIKSQPPSPATLSAISKPQPTS